jgi:hypothetical protein
MSTATHAGAMGRGDEALLGEWSCPSWVESIMECMNADEANTMLSSSKEMQKDQEKGRMDKAPLTQLTPLIIPLHAKDAKGKTTTTDQEWKVADVQRSEYKQLFRGSLFPTRPADEWALEVFGHSKQREWLFHWYSRRPSPTVSPSLPLERSEQWVTSKSLGPGGEYAMITAETRGTHRNAQPSPIGVRHGRRADSPRRLRVPRRNPTRGPCRRPRRQRRCRRKSSCSLPTNRLEVDMLPSAACLRRRATLTATILAHPRDRSGSD